MRQLGPARGAGAVHPPQRHGAGRVPVPQEIALRAAQPDRYPRPVLGSRAVRQARLGELVSTERASTPVGAVKRAGGSGLQSITHNLGCRRSRNRRPVAPQPPVSPVEIVRDSCSRRFLRDAVWSVRQPADRRPKRSQGTSQPFAQPCRESSFCSPLTATRSDTSACGAAGSDDAILVCRLQDRHRLILDTLRWITIGSR